MWNTSDWHWTSYLSKNSRSQSISSWNALPSGLHYKMRLQSGWHTETGIRSCWHLTIESGPISFHNIFLCENSFELLCGPFQPLSDSRKFLLSLYLQFWTLHFQWSLFAWVMPIFPCNTHESSLCSKIGRSILFRAFGRGVYPIRQPQGRASCCSSRACLWSRLRRGRNCEGLATNLTFQIRKPHRL